MKKLLLIPVVVMTGFLAFAFLMPATATTVLRSVAPAAHLTVPTVLSAGSQEQVAANPAAGTQAAGSSAVPGGSSSSAGSSTTLQGSTMQPLMDRGHEVATAAHPNCGRFGNGMHGGKHDFTCPNEPFPAPAS